MDEKKKPFAKTYKFGNSTVIVHSDVLKLTEEERKQWYKDEMEKGNKVLLDIKKTVNEAYRKFYIGEET
ncbi:hypothetical protein [Peribacillus simplex]|uniref:Uncharacterized protein n=1 Tax=Peribacillus simplex TaxID=1478 RepID=A0A9W4L6G2_9BACI|nr:hypothetical protein [Peribacillus simplex]CAH0289237.1 hypothetical protein SRABI133_04182 [Peribacillus simplex]